MAVVAFFTGELGGGGGNFNVPTNFPSGRGRQRGGSSEFLSSNFPWHLPRSLGITEWIIIAAVAILVFFAVVLIFTYIASVFRFILFDSVLSGNCSIRANWSGRQREGRKYFQWSLIVMAVSLSAVVVIFGTPMLFAWSAGIFENASRHVLLLIMGGIVMMMLFVVFLLAAGAVHLISRDMMVPMFALEDLSIGEAWQRARQMIAADQGGYAGYYGMCILLALGVAIIFGIIGLILLVVLLIPMVLIGVVVVAGLAATGWNPLGIILAVLLGVGALLTLMFTLALIYVPAVVFRQNYGMYFFGARYQPLMTFLYPPPPAQPPLMPPPQPIPA